MISVKRHVPEYLFLTTVILLSQPSVSKIIEYNMPQIPVLTLEGGKQERTMTSVTGCLTYVEVEEERAFMGVARHFKKCSILVEVIPNNLRKRNLSPSLLEKEIRELLYPSH